ncbi:ankyrin repeat-containing domain protein [Fusarium oxysporum f. sp. albedinis]|nr:ankyrin repeat-containing domain protein [Fusarium oxysporum f. sp. albedinis]
MSLGPTFTQYGSGDQYNVGGKSTQNNATGEATQYNFIRNKYYTRGIPGQDSPKVKPEVLCLRSLAFPEMESRYYDIATATPGTCEWLLKDGTFNTWKQEHRALLWIKGHPGSGKSTLLKRAFDSVKGSQSQRGDIVLSFFFLARGSEEQKTPFGFWRSVLHQLLPFAPDTLTGLVDTFVSRSENRGGHRTSWEWHMNELRECFKSSIAEALEKRSVWLFVDALDEVGEEIARGFVDELEMFIKDLPSTRNSFRMCFTCRIFPPLGKNDEFVTILGQQNNQDVSKYIERRLYSQECTYSARIQQEITSRACGNFTWARLVLDKVLLTWRPDDSNWEAIKDQIASTHQELDLLYMNLLDDMTDASLRLIRWVCFSLRPMYPGELQSAMEADLWALNEISRDQSQPLQGDNYRDNSHEFGVMIPILSHGLAEVVTSDNGQIVQFIHESVRDFLTGEGLPRLGSKLQSSGPDYSTTNITRMIGCIHSWISRVCVRYLVQHLAMEDNRHEWSDESHWQELDPMSLRQNDNVAEFPFIYYATTMWVEHVNQNKIENVPYSHFLDDLGWPNENFVEQWAQLWKVLGQPSEKSPPKGTTVTHIVARYGLSSEMETILEWSEESRYAIDTKDENGQTPFSLAAENGHKDIVALLLKANNGWIVSLLKSFLECLRNALESFLILDSPVPLREAIPKAWRRMWIWLLLRLGLTKVNIGSKDNQGRTPLLWAARRGHTEIVRQLLAAGDKHADTCDVEGMSPFAWAAFNRHEDTMQSLYESGTVNINSTDSGFGYTPLIRAVLDGEDRVVKRLTRMDKGEYKIDFNVNDAIGRRALSLAVIWHNTNVAKILLHTGRCDINWKDLNGHTALFEAASRGNDELVNLFLGVKGIDIGATDNKGRTALAAAVMWKNERAALLILGRGPINHDQVDESGTTALSFAVQNCLLGVVTELLRLGQVSINSEDQFGRTVSWWATQSGNVDIQNALLHYSRRKRNPRYGDVGRPEV